MEKTLVFRTLNSGQVFRGRVRNPNRTIGEVASRLAAKANLAGSFEVIDSYGKTVRPETPLSEIPGDETQYTLAPELTPA